MNKDEMIKEAKCHNCIHFPVCSWWVTANLIANETHKYYCAHYANEKGYHKVADDEIVIKKSEYVVIPKQDWEDRAYIHAMENHLCQKCRDMIGETFVSKEEADYWKNRCKEIGDVTSKETAREIFYKLKETLIINNEENTEWFDYDFTLETINELAKEKGIELE